MTGHFKCNISNSSKHISKHTNCFCVVCCKVYLLAKDAASMFPRETRMWDNLDIENYVTKTGQEKKKNKKKIVIFKGKDPLVIFDKLKN